MVPQPGSTCTPSFGKVRNDLDAAAGPAESDEKAEVRARTAFGDIVIHRS